jgi:hypothetical protein
MDDKCRGAYIIIVIVIIIVVAAYVMTSRIETLLRTLTTTSSTL